MLETSLNAARAQADEGRMSSLTCPILLPGHVLPPNTINRFHSRSFYLNLVTDMLDVMDSGE